MSDHHDKTHQYNSHDEDVSENDVSNNYDHFSNYHDQNH